MDLFSRAEEIRIGALFARVVYGDGQLPKGFRGSDQPDNGLDDDYADYFQNLSNPSLNISGWDTLDDIQLGASFQYDVLINDGIAKDLWAHGSFESHDLYKGVLISKIPILPDELEGIGSQGLLAKGVLSDGSGALVLSFRGTDEDLAPTLRGEAWSGNGLFKAYEMFRPLVDAAYRYATERSNGIQNVIVSGHSLGGSLVDIFTAIDAKRFEDAGLRLTIVSLASAGVDPNLFTDALDVTSYKGDPRLNQAVVDLSSGSLVLRAPPNYYGLSHSEDMVTFPDVNLVSVTNMFGPYYPNSPIVTNKNFESVLLKIDMPRLDNSEVNYIDADVFTKAYGAEHNRDLYWINIDSLMRDVFLSRFSGQNIIMGISDYSNALDWDGRKFARGATPEEDRLFGAYTKAKTFGVDNDERPRALSGTDAADYILGLTGNDDIYGQGGADLISGGDGDDEVYGGPGNDTIHGGDGTDDLRGEGDNDTIFGGTGGDTISGGPGNDTLDGGTEPSDLVGIDTLYGEGDNDTLISRQGVQHLWGGPGADTFVFHLKSSATSIVGTVFDTIKDYNQDTPGNYDPTQGDVIDLSPIVGQAHAAGEAIKDLWELKRSPTDGVLRLYADADGTGSAFTWQVVAILEGVPSGEAGVIVIPGFTGGGPPVPAPVPSAPGSYRISPSAQTVVEDNTTISFTITRPDARLTETVYVSTVFDLGSTNDNDYQGLLDVPLTFAAGDPDETISITIKDGNSTPELPETFGVLVQALPSPNLDRKLENNLTSATFTIIDDDAASGPAVFTTGNDREWITPTGGAQVFDGLAGTDTAVLDLSGWNAGIGTSTSGGATTFSSGGNSVRFTNVEHFFIRGGNGSDTLTTRAGNDGLHGGPGNDTLNAGAGINILEGGAGDDTIFVSAFGNIVSGGPDTDTVNVSLGGLTQDLTINLRTGQGAGASWTGVELVTGTLGSGSDTLIGGYALASVDGGNGTDSLVLDYSGTLPDGQTASRIRFRLHEASTNEQVFFGNAPVDFALVSFERATILATNGDDVIVGAAGANNLYGLGGNDWLIGSSGTDILDGGEGDDRLTAVGLGDNIIGGPGTDTLFVNFGGLGDDLGFGDFVGDEFVVVMIGSLTQDLTLNLSTGNLFTGEGTGTSWTGVERVEGILGHGNDTVIGGYALASLDGGSGTDSLTLDYSGTLPDGRTASRISLDLSASPTDEYVLLGNTWTGFSLGSFERSTIRATNGDDWIVGASGPNILHGLGGDDELIGGAGIDYLDGGEGDDELRPIGLGDTIIGGPGTDTLIFGFGVDFLGSLTQDLTINLVTGNLFTGEGPATSWTGIERIFAELGQGNDTLIGGYALGSLTGGGGTDSVMLDYSGTLADGRKASSVFFNLRDGYSEWVAFTDNTYVTLYLASFERATITATDGNDTLIGPDGGNNFYGLGGADQLTGGAGIDLIEGGAGNDNLNGEAAYDTYRFARGWGQDTIIDPDSTGKLVFEGIAPSELSFTNVGGALIISDGTNRITFLSYVDSVYDYDIEYLGLAQVPPVAIDDAFVTEENRPLTVSAPGVLVNDADDNGDTLIANLIAGPANGVLVLSTDGSFTYTPDANFSGSDSFTYRASDGTLDSLVATVSITVTPAPAPPSVTVINGTNGNDIIRTAAAGGSLNGLPNATDSGNSIFASLGNDTVIAGAGADSIDGGDGHDFLDGGAGNDTITGGPGADFLSGGPGNDTIQTGTSLDGTELAFGDSDNDDLTGGSSGNGLALLFGGAGNDIVRGNNFTGNLADYSDRSLAVVANLSAGTATIGGIETDTLVNVRGIRTGAGNDQITGTSGSDLILPGLGNNVVDGGLGVDRLMYAYLSNGVTVDLLNGFSTKLGDGSTDTLSNIENVRGTNYNDSLLGNNADNDLSGLAGDDIIEGRGGYDTANYFAFNSAGPGNSYFADPGSFPFNQGVMVNLTSGSATDSWGGTDTLIGIEAVNGTFFNDDLTGIAFADGTRSLLTGNAGNDTLRGTSTDRSITANYTSDQTRVLVNLSAGSETLAGTFVAAGTAKDGYGGTDTIISIQSVRGSAFNDIIVGTALADRLEGEGGNDTIYGRAGNDQVRGNAGNDALFGEDGDDAVQGGAGFDTASGGAGYDNLRFDTASATQGAVASLTTGQITDEFGNAETIGAVNDFEMLVGSNLADDLEGKALPGDITQLEARAGNDTLRAGSGNSAGVVAYYAFDPDSDGNGIGIIADLTLATQQVTDGYGDKDTLIGVGGVRGTRFDDLITGNDADNWFRGEGGDDVIDGRGGFDILSYTSFASNGVQVSGITATLADGAGTVIDGLGGTDIVSGIEQINGNARADTITVTGSQGMKVLGNDGDDVITGGGGDDDLSGGNGADTVNGGGGNDILRGVSGHTNAVGALDIFTGGAGSDTFIIDSTVLSGSAVADVVTDFEGDDGGDIVDLANVIAYLIGAGEITAGQNPFATGHLRLVNVSAVLQVDWDGADGPGGFSDLLTMQSTTPSILTAFNFGGLDPLVTRLQVVDDVYAMGRGRVLTVDAPGVGLNDVNPMPNPMLFLQMSQPASGTVTFNDDGSFTYESDGSAVGSVSFTYWASNGVDVGTATVTLLIEERAEVLHGSADPDIIVGYGLDDVLTGLEGNDTLDGGDGPDTADYSAAPAGITTDLAVSAIVQDGYGFTDMLVSIEAIRGSDGGHDLILGNDAPNILLGQGGNDRLAGRGGNDLLEGGAGNDLLFAGDGNDTVHGGDGDDRVLGDGGDDALNGDAGNDIIWAGAGNDEIDGGSGDDTLVGEGGEDVILGGDGNDNIRGLDGNDVIDGGTGRDRIQGGNGADTVHGGADDDRIGGDAGDDTLFGDAGNDVLGGDAGNDTVLGGAGNDILNGGNGQDRLDGGAGLDMLNGGVDADAFVLAHLQADRDWISSFVSGEDTLEISAALFGGGLAPGALDPSRLVVGTNPVATQPGVGTFLFDTDDGRLRWDADGSGPGWPPVIATLTGVTSLNASDFMIV
jgi:Ca2+-binding RTX toxin-like protein